MTLARYQFTVTDDAGNVIPSASVEVRREITGAPLVTLYSDRAGATPIGNPMVADGNGFVAFHVVGGAYKITASSGAFSREWRYVGIGLTQESDTLVSGITYNFDSATANANPGTGLLRLNNATPASVTHVYVNDVNSLGADLGTWFDTMDDGGSTSNRGTIVLRNATGNKMLVATVTGAVTDNTTYHNLTIAYVGAIGAFEAGELVSVEFMRAGLDTSGDVVGPASAVDNRIAVFDSISGKLIKDGGATIASIGQGKQLLAWVPAGAMVPNTTNGPSTGTLERTTNKNMYKTLDFDATTSESAQFLVAMPKKWNEGTITFVPYWAHAATTTNFGVVWGLSGVAVSNDDTTDVAFGTAQNSADTGGTTADLYIGPESSAITVGGTPAELDLVNFKIARLPADASDNMAIDAGLVGIKVFYTTDTTTEA